MKILKASAGSGKTYRLSKTYTELLLSDKEHSHPYRHILAVTFTNKATADMKKRILENLYKLSSTNGRAKELLIDMLHDYSAFSVSTIDKFFQYILKAFAREIGQFADYRIELDETSLSRETVDRILDSLSPEDDALLAWLKRGLYDSLEQGDRFSLEKALYDMGKSLRSEEFRSVLSSSGRSSDDVFSKEHLSCVKKMCGERIRSYRDKMLSFGIEPKTPFKTVLKLPAKRILAGNPALAEYIEKNRQSYITACLIYNNLYSLGTAGEFLREFNNILSEKNEMCLGESNRILKDIVNNSDAPFVYEKTGTRYDHFLLDEFQDTSLIQWDNFLPLLKESESRGGKNLLVGDIKQSIYRFRGSDWTLLGSRVTEDFPSSETEALTGNWRSTEKVVSFNNDFFDFASRKLHLEDIYSDVRQTPCAEPVEREGGLVRVSFCDKDDVLNKLSESVEEARAAGAKLGDIVILVRKGKEGAEVANMLVSQGIPVISEGALEVKSSIVVRRLVSLLCSIDNPEDKLGSFLAKEMSLSYPSEYHSLVDLCESLLRSLETYDGESFVSEIPYIHAFLDDVLEWSTQYGNNLRKYLEHWEESSLTIGSPDEGCEAVRIMTVHKSKGLEFPYVIFPFADRVELFKSDIHWCHLNSGETALDGVYPVRLGSDAPDSAFAEDLQKERKLQLVDNINVFYVALTRATKVMHIISSEPSKKFKDSLRKGCPEYSCLSDLLYEFVGGMDEYRWGEMYDFVALEGRREEKLRKQEKENGGRAAEPFPARCPSIALGGRFMVSSDAAAFFSDDVGRKEFSLSSRIGGTVLHEILSRVRNLGDVAPSVRLSVEQGSLPAEAEEKVRELLLSRVSSHPEWFPEDGRRVDRERTIFAPDPENPAQCEKYRPDRVVFERDGKRVSIVDFKFGRVEENSYRTQVGRYASLYSALGYGVSSAAIWYVLENKCDYIECE